MKANVLLSALGLFFGWALGRIGFADWGEVHRMFVFADLRLFLTFLGAVPLAALGFAVLGRGRNLPPRPIHKGSVPGGILFGAGWALTGACPAIMLVQLGEGKLGALFTLSGALVGTALYPRLNARLFRFDAGSCEA